MIPDFNNPAFSHYIELIKSSVITFAPMNDFQKYSRLMILIFGCFIGFGLLVALLVFVFRLLSITIFNIPGFDVFFQYIILIIPYTIFFVAYYYLYKKINVSKSKASRVIARIFLAVGILICTSTLVFATLVFSKIKNEWLNLFDENSHFALILQLLILLGASLAIASGDAGEKDWMERSK